MEPVTALLTAIVSIITSAVMGLIKRLAPALEAAPKVVHTVIVAVLSAPMAWLSGEVGVHLPADPTLWTGDMVNAVLIWLMAMGAHAALKAVKRQNTGA